MKKRSEREVRLLLYRSRKKMLRLNSCPNDSYNSIVDDDSKKPELAYQKETNNTFAFRLVRCRFGNDEYDAYGIPIEPPEIFSLVNNSSDVLRFLEKIREHFYEKKTQQRPYPKLRYKKWIGYYVNFTRIQKISTAAALVLAAEFYRLKEKSPRVLNQKAPELGLVDFHKWKTQSIGTLYNLGFLDLLEVKLQENEVTKNSENDRRIQKFMTGNSLEPESITYLKDSLAQLTTKLDTVEKIKLGI